jgi:uncharacterized membrane protein YphA (DoxX/SURF4 family)
MSKIASKLPTAARLLVGGVFTLFGFNGFFHFLPMPPSPLAAGEFLGSLVATGYMIPLIKGTEVIAGLLLLSGRFVPLALTVLAPLLVNIAAFHLFLAPAGLATPVVLVAATLYLAWSYRDAFRPMLQATTRASQEARARSPRNVAAIA